VQYLPIKKLLLSASKGQVGKHYRLAMGRIESVEIEKKTPKDMAYLPGFASDSKQN